MAKHLRFSGASDVRQRRALVELIQTDPVLMGLLQRVANLALPEALVSSGVIYNSVWNALTDRPRQHGVNDADIAYFDPDDLSYGAEDRVINRAQRYFSGCPVPVEVRNQARVHLWFPDKFGLAYPKLTSSADALRYFSTKTHAVAACIERDKVVIHAPFGLDDLFSFRLTPNTVLNNRLTHERKAARAMALWPEREVVPWPG